MTRSDQGSTTVDKSNNERHVMLEWDSKIDDVGNSAKQAMFKF